MALLLSFDYFCICPLSLMPHFRSTRPNHWKERIGTESLIGTKNPFLLSFSTFSCDCPRQLGVMDSRWPNRFSILTKQDGYQSSDHWWCKVCIAWAGLDPWTLSQWNAEFVQTSFLNYTSHWTFFVAPGHLNMYSLSQCFHVWIHDVVGKSWLLHRRYIPPTPTWMSDNGWL